MAQRDRRRAGGGEAPARPTPKHAAEPAIDGPRTAPQDSGAPHPSSRDGRPSGPARPTAPPPHQPPRPPTRGARAAARDEAVRATLEPYDPGERPRAIVVAVSLALMLALANLALMLSGYKVQDQSASPLSGVLFALVMVAAAAGMWRLRYWAVLGFQALLGIAIVIFSLFLLRASNLLGAALCLFVIGGGGWLFWKLVRVLSRLQLPRPG